MKVFVNDALVVVNNKFEDRCFIYDRKNRVEYDINNDCFNIIEDIKKNSYDIKTLCETYDKEFIDSLFDIKVLTYDNQKNINNVKRLDKHNNVRVFIELTNKCNLNCRHCYGGFACTNNTFIPLEKLKDIISKSSQAGVYQIDFTGGEPTLYPHLDELLEYAYNAGVMVRIFTNLTLFNDELNETFKKHCVKDIVTSLDSCIKEEHDNFRGKSGSFDKTLAAIKKLKSEDFNISLNTMIGQHNKKHIDELVDFINDLQVKSVLDVIIPEGRASNLNEDIIESAKIIKSIYQKNDEIVNKDSISVGCGVGNRFVYIKSNGSIYLCPSLIGEEFKVADIDNFDIDEIWTKLEKKYKNLSCSKKCNECKNCTGGCRARAKMLHGSIYDEDDVYCIINEVM